MASVQRVLASEIGTYVGQQVRLQGWLHRLRQMGGINFAVLRDRSGLVQTVLTHDEIKPLDGLLPESVLTITGTVIEAPQAPGGYELHGVSIEVITPVTEPTPYELYKKGHKVTLPVFLEHAVVGQRGIDRRAVLKIAAGVMAGFRETLCARDFTEIQTPKLVASATESGANVFPVEYFGRQAFLAQSPQFYKQIMVGVFERVFEVGPVFRAEPHSTTRHINQYVSLDVEFGFIKDHFDVMEMVTIVLRGILDHLKQHCQAELDLLQVQMPTFPTPIPWIWFPDAQRMLAEQFGLNDALHEPDLSPEHERTLGQWAHDTHGSDFLFVTGYPMVKRPFYTHPDPKDPRYASGFDLLFRGTELITGGQRLHRYEDYVAAAQHHKYALDPFKEYFEAFKFGMPPHGGFAIGMERFVMQLLKLDNIRHATLFPRDIHRLTP